MEWWKTWADGFLGIANKGFRWRCHPASMCCAPRTAHQKIRSALNSRAAVLQGACA